jgi:hypothetical protein
MSSSDGAVWDPPTQRKCNALERVQRRGARFVMNNYRQTSSVTSMMSQLGWEELRLRRARIMMLCPLVMAPVGMRNGSGGISTRLFAIFNSKIVLIRALLSLSSSNLVVTSCW